LSRDRKIVLKSVVNDPGTLVILEAPHRLQSTLKDLLSVLGDRRITVCRELTKIHEEIFHGSVSRAASWFSSPRGEFTLVIEGSPEIPVPHPAESDISQQLLRLRRQGMAARDVIAVVSQETGLSRRELYQLWLKLA
jgi:16S rRNA (cytidine1402-2'-O)-methyltransferase